MGIAAYNRGTQALARQIDSERRSVEFEVMERLNALPKFADAGTPFGPINFVSDHGGFWAQCPVTGFGYWYSTLSEAMQRWRVQIVAYDNGVWKAEVTPK